MYKLPRGVIRKPGVSTSLPHDFESSCKALSIGASPTGCRSSTSNFDLVLKTADEDDDDDRAVIVSRLLSLVTLRYHGRLKFTFAGGWGAHTGNDLASDDGTDKGADGRREDDGGDDGADTTGRTGWFKYGTGTTKGQRDDASGHAQ